MIDLIFWGGLLLIGYTYIGYPILLALLARLRRPWHGLREVEAPLVSVLVPAYNEGSVIAEKVANTLEQDYPLPRMEILVGSDGSSDRTAEVVGALGDRHPNVRLFDFQARRGKVAVLNDLVREAEGEVLVFTDANSMMNSGALARLTAHFSDPLVGAVSGEKVIVSRDADDLIGEGEGIYWRYESYIKAKESEIHSVIGADGALWAMRRALFQEAPRDTLVDDFLISMRVLAAGGRIVYEKGAYVREEALDDWKAEYVRKVRIAAGAFQSIPRLKTFLSPAQGMSFLFYVSHKLIRWIAPFIYLCALAANVVLASGSTLYTALLAAQLAAFGAVFAGYLCKGRPEKNRFLHFVFYFAMTNFAQLMGLVNLVRRRQKVTWEKKDR